MQEQPTIDERVADLETRLAQLERRQEEEKETNDQRDLALLYRSLAAGQQQIINILTGKGQSPRND